MAKNLVQEVLVSKDKIEKKNNLAKTVITYCENLRQKLSKKNKKWNSVRAIRELRSEM